MGAYVGEVGSAIFERWRLGLFVRIVAWQNLKSTR